jgi:Hint domain
MRKEVRAMPDTGPEVSVACFVRGSRIATPGGDVPIERLAVGDVVETLAAELTPIRWIGHRHVDCGRHPNPPAVWPVRIAPNTFGSGMPCRDLWLSPDHAVFAEGILIPIKHLINGVSVSQVSVTTVAYYHIELTEHDILFAEGLMVESYLDTGNRSGFGNSGNVTRLHPDFARSTGQIATVGGPGPCARVVTHGPELERVRNRLAARMARAGQAS